MIESSREDAKIALHQSIESLFLHAGPPSPSKFENATCSGWPFLEFEVLNLRDRTFLKDQIDAFNLLQRVPEIQSFLDHLNFKSDSNLHLRKNLEWRASHMHANMDFWHLTHADFPRQLVEDTNIGYTYDDPKANIRIADLEEQLFSQHPVYKNAILVRNMCRTWHRGDGECGLSNEDDIYRLR